MSLLGHGSLRCLIITLGPSVHPALLGLDDEVGQMLRDREGSGHVCQGVVVMHCRLVEIRIHWPSESAGE